MDMSRNALAWESATVTRDSANATPAFPGWLVTVVSVGPGREGFVSPFAMCPMPKPWPQVSWLTFPFSAVACPNGCSGRGTCSLVSTIGAELGSGAASPGQAAPSGFGWDYSPWDKDMSAGCNCEFGAFGPDCSLSECSSTAVGGAMFEGVREPACSRAAVSEQELNPMPQPAARARSLSLARRYVPTSGKPFFGV